jgi:hypothetical protein
MGVRLRLRQAQADAGDIVLLYADESEALTHPYLAHAWAERGADLRVNAPGQSKKVAMPGEPLGLRWPHLFGQVGGEDKLVPGSDYAAAFSSDAVARACPGNSVGNTPRYASSGVRPASAE